MVTKFRFYSDKIRKTITIKVTHTEFSICFNLIFVVNLAQFQQFSNKTIKMVDKKKEKERAAFVEFERFYYIHG